MTTFDAPPDAVKDAQPGSAKARQKAINAIAQLLGIYPQMRLGQLIVLAVPERHKGDPFNVTDEELADGLVKLYGQLMGT